MQISPHLTGDPACQRHDAQERAGDRGEDGGKGGRAAALGEQQQFGIQHKAIRQYEADHREAERRQSSLSSSFTAEDLMPARAAAAGPRHPHAHPLRRTHPFLLRAGDRPRRLAAPLAVPNLAVPFAVLTAADLGIGG